MPSEREASPLSRPQDPGRPSPRLGYLLKQAQARFSEFASAALAPLGLSTREWATLISLDDRRPLSQREVALRAGIDRTTMVALVDELQSSPNDIAVALARWEPDQVALGKYLRQQYSDRRLSALP